MAIDTYWVDCDEDIGDADYSLHAGITKALLCDNLQHAHEATQQDFCCGPDEAEQIISSASWAWIRMPPIRVPLRPSISGGWRTYAVEYQAEISASGGDVIVRTMLLPAWLENVTLDATNCVPDFDAYSDDTITATSYDEYSGEITPTGGGIASVYGHRMERVPFLSLRFAAKSSDNRTLKIRSPRFVEGY